MISLLLLSSGSACASVAPLRAPRTSIPSAAARASTESAPAAVRVESSAAAVLGRRTAILAAAAAPLSQLSAPAFAADMAMDLQGDWLAKRKLGEWADHEGAFDDDFFKDFKTTDSGFKFKIVQQGEGEKAQPFQKVFVHYSGYLLNGKKFDSSYDKGEPFGFRLSKGKVIPGWESIVSGMNPGMKVIVQIPPQYAYGDKGVGNGLVPPNSPLVFYMELRRLGSIKGDKPRLGGIMTDSSDTD